MEKKFYCIETEAHYMYLNIDHICTWYINLNGALVITLCDGNEYEVIGHDDELMAALYGKGNKK